MDIIEIFKLYGSILVDSSKAESSIAKTEKKAEGLGSKLGHGIATAGKWGLAIGTAAVAAGAGMMALGKTFADSAAKAQAMDSQFSQVFGKLEGEAQKTVETLGQNFGMLPNRIKPAYTSISSMMMGFGMSTEESMAAASDAMTYAADAAAFYDVSMENSAGALTSFLKGNTAAAESIGIFATVSGMATFASEDLGLAWNDLDEAGKQIVRLKYVEKMQEAAGATGQAARESKSLENVTGNLKQAWEDLKAKVGAPLLEPIIESLMALIPLMQKAADYIVDHMPQIKKVVESAFKVIKQVAQTAMVVFESMLPILKPLWKFIVWAFPLITGAISSTFKTIKPLIEGVGKVIDALAKSLQWAYEKWMQWTGRESDRQTPIDDGSFGDGGGGSRPSKPKGPGHASGLAYVPYDGYEATLHKGERVLSRGEVAQAQTVKHTGTITVRGVNSRDELIGVTQILARDIAENDRRLPNRARLIPIG